MTTWTQMTEAYTAAIVEDQEPTLTVDLDPDFDSGDMFEIVEVIEG